MRQRTSQQLPQGKNSLGSSPSVPDAAGPAAIAADGMEWISQSTRLRFQLGEFCLAIWRFRSLVLNVPYSRLTDDIESVPLPTLPPGIQSALLPSHPVREEQQRLRLRNGRICYVPMQALRYHVTLSGTFDDYVRLLNRPTKENRAGSKRLHNVRRSLTKFAEAGSGRLDFRDYTRPEEVEEFHRLAVQVSRGTYQARLSKAGLPETAEFLEEMREQARRGLLHGYLLCHEEKPVAFAYCYGHGDSLTYDRVGYDSAYRRWSPGSMLLYLLLEDQFRRGQYRLVDFGMGEAAYKDYFSTDQKICADIFFFVPTPLNIIRVLLHNALFHVSRGIVRTLRFLKLRDRMKLLIRRQATQPAASHTGNA